MAKRQKLHLVLAYVTVPLLYRIKLLRFQNRFQKHHKRICAFIHVGKRKENHLYVCDSTVFWMAGACCA